MGDDLPEARILITGQPIDGPAEWEGPLEEARTRVAAMSADERSAISIWTPGHVFEAEELLAERPGHEHDPIG